MAQPQKIEKLTPEQEALVPIWQETWLKRGRFTDPRSEKVMNDNMIKAINVLYADLGYPPPIIIDCLNPEEMCTFPELVLGMKSKKMQDQVTAVQLRDLMNTSALIEDNKFNENLNNSWFIQWWAGWRVFYRFCEEVLGITYDADDSRKLSLWLDLCRYVHAFLPFDTHCFVSRYPTALQYDEQNRLHATKGAALSYTGGVDKYVTRGTRIDDKTRIGQLFFDEGEEGFIPITLQDMNDEKDQEIKTRMLSKLGVGNFMEMANAKVVQSDYYGELIEMDLPGRIRGRALKCINSTPEPDGSYKPYILTVPPEIKTAHEAAAWSFGLTVDEYHPLIET